jgi:Flp pilus assembly pilin Flp
VIQESSLSTNRSPSRTFEACAPNGAPEYAKGGEDSMTLTFSDLIAYFRARFAVEEGQTMAEYGVVLAVICALTAGAFVLLRGGIVNALSSVRSFLP